MKNGEATLIKHLGQIDDNSEQWIAQTDSILRESFQINSDTRLSNSEYHHGPSNSVVKRSLI